MGGRRRILVAGAAGFIGSHLVDALLSEGHQVIGVDNIITGRLKNLEKFEGDSAFSFLEHDITREFDVGKVDCLFNLASPASPVDYARYGIETLKVGSCGTMLLLEMAKRYKARFVHTSTSECYGDPLVSPQPESYWGNVNPIGLRSVYDESKRFSEALIMAYHRYQGLDTRIARVFNTYGPNLKMDDGRVISNFVSQALRGDDLTVYGDGSQTRSFCYVSDQIDGILRLSHSNENLPVNIGNPDEFTMLECAKIVLEITQSKSKMKFCALPADDPKQRRPDISKAWEVLKWRPKVDLRTGLELCLPWFKACLQEQPVES